MAEDDSLIDVAAAIADGTAVDWRALEATAGTPEARERLRRLELLAGIERLKADLTYPRPDENRLHESILHPHGVSRVELDASPAPVSWGPLTIVEKIGRGTFGDVYRAREARLDRDVALKLLRHKDAASSASSDVIEEARLMAKVRHPNVTTIYGAERIDGRVGLWMEFIDGRTLEAELAARGPFGANDLCRVGTEVAAALSAVHRAGLLHRDVKAHNVLRAADGRLMLTDFGTGRPLASQGELIDELAGSPLYLAPEVLNGLPATVQSDIYSLGVLLYRLATDSFPVTGRSLQDLRAEHAAGTRARLRDARRDLPNQMVEAIDGAIGSAPADRPPSADALARMLVLTPARPQRSGRVWLSVGGAAVLVVALAGWYAMPRSSSTVGADVIEQSVLTGEDARGVIAVSPDGRLTAYIDGNTGNLGVRDLTTGARRLLTTSGTFDGANYSYANGGARFSRDGRRLAYNWVEEGKDETRYELRVIDVDRPHENQPLYVSADVEWLSPHDWSPDGRFIAMGVEHDYTADVDIVAAGGGPPTVLTSVDWRGVQHMAFSPDGRYLAYDAVPNDMTAERDVFVVSTDTHQAHSVITGPGRDSVVGWSRDSSLLVASDRRGAMSLWRQDMADGAPQGEPALLKADIHEGTFGATTDGRVFYQMTTRNEPITVATVDLNTGTRRAPLTTPIISGLSDHRKPTWSPDGRSFAYISATSTDEPTLPTQRILSIQSGNSLRTLSVKLARWYSSSWAPDGRSLLVFALDFQRHVGIFRLDASTGDVKPVIVDHNDIYPWWPQWTKDARHFYYMRGPHAWDAAIDTEFVERDITSGTDRVVFRNRDLKRPDGTAAPPLRDWIVSPDGKTVAGLETNDGYHAVWVKPLGSLTAREIYRVPKNDCQVPITHFALIWTPDSRGVIVNTGVRCNPTTRELWVVPVAPGQAAHKIDIGDVRLRNEAPAVSPDGHQVAFQTGDDPVYEIRAVQYQPSRR